MTIHREIGPSYHHKPIVQGVNYSLLMVESEEEVLVKEERSPEATPAVIPPPVFPWRLTAASVFNFSCFSTTSSQERPGGPLNRWF
jgi:hypothetical protein